MGHFIGIGTLLGVRKIPINWVNAPIICDLLVLIWTACVFKFTNYGDYWASYPVAAIFVGAVLLHLLIVIREKPRMKYVAYAALHIPFSFVLYILCLTLITKDYL